MCKRKGIKEGRFEDSGGFYLSYTVFSTKRRNKVSFSFDLKDPEGLIGQTSNISIFNIFDFESRQ